jgi:hypothetical protein
MQEESFDYEDVMHVKVASGRSLLYGLVGAAVFIGGIVMLIQNIFLMVVGKRHCTQRDYYSCMDNMARDDYYPSYFNSLSEYCEERYPTRCYTVRGLYPMLILNPILVLLAGGLFLGYFASGSRKAFVTLDMTKDKEVGSFQPALISYETIMNPFSMFSCLGKLRRHVTRELSFQKKDAFAATSKICAIRQGLKEKLAGTSMV